MSKKSRNNGPDRPSRKGRPSRKDLLKELESIHQTLVCEMDFNDDDIRSDDNNTLTDSPERQIPDMEHSDAPHSTTTRLNEHASTPQPNPHPDSIPIDPQSLFTNADSADRTSINTPPEENTENPFLPQHIKERLEKEKTLYQQDIDAALKIPGLDPYAEKATVQEAIIDELVKIYLPQIEEELRRRLKQSAENDTN